MNPTSLAVLVLILCFDFGFDYHRAATVFVTVLQEDMWKFLQVVNKTWINTDQPNLYVPKLRYEHPLLLRIGEGEGNVTHHSYQTFLGPQHHQKSTSSLESGFTQIGVLRGENIGNQLNIFGVAVKGSIPRCASL